MCNYTGQTCTLVIQHWKSSRWPFICLQETIRVKIKALKWAAAQFGHATVNETEQWTLTCDSNAQFRKQLSAKRHEYVRLFLLVSSFFLLLPLLCAPCDPFRTVHNTYPVHFAYTSGSAWTDLLAAWSLTTSSSTTTW